MKNKKSIIILLVFIFTFMLMTTQTNVVLARSADFSALDEGGNKILDIVQKIGYWIILIKCIADLIKHGLQGNLHQIGKTIMTYILLYASLFFVPFILKMIEGLF